MRTIVLIDNDGKPRFANEDGQAAEIEDLGPLTVDGIDGRLWGLNLIEETELEKKQMTNINLSTIAKALLLTAKMETEITGQACGYEWGSGTTIVFTFYDESQLSMNVLEKEVRINDLGRKRTES